MTDKRARGREDLAVVYGRYDKARRPGGRDHGQIRVRSREVWWYMSRTDEVFRPALAGKKIPILTLDNKWHRLFTQKEYTAEIKHMESEMNNLLKRQGKVNAESKELKKLKKKSMDEIVVLADAMGKAPSGKLEKKMAQLRQRVNECNEKMDAYEEEMVDLPRQISQLNQKLMLATMEVCYRKLQKNTEELEEIEEWIGSIRRELKKKVVRKQEKEAINHQLYSYMHDIFGADVIEIFDMKYNPEEKYRQSTEHLKSSGPAKDAEPIKSAEAVKNRESVKGSEPTESGESAMTGESETGSKESALKS